MKKPIKITLLVIAILVFIFLMLPFIFPSAETEKAAQRAAADAVTPQIFTSNPLAKLVNRLARFFGRNPVPRSGIASANNVQPLTDALYADARVTENADADSTNLEADPEAIAQAFENAALQNSEGEWVLIRQQAPEGSAGGMHEVNVKENAYDRYVKQERAARYNPAAAAARAKNEVPDSKLARMFRPIKRFFGLDEEPRMADTTLLTDDRTNGSSAAGSADAPLRTLNSSSRSGGGASGAGTMGSAYFRHPAADLLSMIDPTRAARNAANIIADGAFPNPKSAEEAAQKDEIRQGANGRVLNELSQKLSEQLTRTAQGQPAEDKIIETLGCGTKALTTSPSTDCDVEHDTPASTMDVTTVKNQNKELFLQRTQYNLPPAPLTVVFSKAGGNEQLAAALEELGGESVEVYQYMLNTTDCVSQSCFWVANSIQTTPDLKEIVEGAGPTFKGDPLGKYDRIKQEFTAQKMANLPEDADEEARQKAQTQADRAATPYVLYTAKELMELQNNDKAFIAGKGNVDQVTALYFAKAGDAQQFAHESGEAPLFFYGKDGSVVNGDNGSPQDRATQLTNDMADLIIFAKQEFQQATSQAGTQAISDQMRPRMQALIQALEQQKKDFNQRNGKK